PSPADLPGPDAEASNEPDDATGNDAGEQSDCVAPDAAQLRLQNTLTPRFAVEHALRIHPAAQAALRVGYFYEPSPLPSGVQTHRIMDNPRHVLSAGYEIALSAPLPPVRVALAVQWHHLVERDF